MTSTKTVTYTVTTRDVDGSTRRTYKTAKAARTRFEDMVGYTIEECIEEQCHGRSVRPAWGDIKRVRGTSNFGTVVCIEMKVEEALPAVTLTEEAKVNFRELGAQAAKASMAAHAARAAAEPTAATSPLTTATLDYAAAIGNERAIQAAALEPLALDYGVEFKDNGQIVEADSGAEIVPAHDAQEAEGPQARAQYAAECTGAARHGVTVAVEWIDGDQRYTMKATHPVTGYTVSHSLAVSVTDEGRLLAHLQGFVNNVSSAKLSAAKRA